VQLLSHRCYATAELFESALLVLQLGSQLADLLLQLVNVLLIGNEINVALHQPIYVPLVLFSEH